MNKLAKIVIILGAVIAVLLIILLWPTGKQPVKPVDNNPVAVQGIEVTMPKSDDWVSSPMEITGVVNGNGWAGFEGQVGGVKLLDSNGNLMASAGLKAVTDWTKLPTNFDVTLEFKNPGNSETGSLVFSNENASGDPAKSKEFILPVRFALGK